VHDAIEGIQVGIVTLTGATNGTSATAMVTFPRAFASPPQVILGLTSPLVGAAADQITATGFRALSRRLDGVATAFTGNYCWIAVGPIA
jgi:hypothetical protein